MFSWKAFSKGLMEDFLLHMAYILRELRRYSVEGQLLRTAFLIPGNRREGKESMILVKETRMCHPKIRLFNRKSILSLKTIKQTNLTLLVPFHIFTFSQFAALGSLKLPSFVLSFLYKFIALC